MTFASATATRRRWIAAGAVAVVGHLAIAGMVLLEPSPQVDDVHQSAIAIEFATMAEATDAPVKEAAPGPDQVEAEQQHPIEPDTPTPPFDPPPKVQIADVRPEVVVATKQAPRPQPVASPLPPAPATTQRVAIQAEAVDRKQAAPTVGGLASGHSAQEDSWEARLLAKLQRMKRYPGSAQRLRQEDVVYVRVAIDRRGRLLSSAVQRSHGFALLDREAADLLRRAAPFPPPPAQVEGERIDLTIPVEFFLTRRAGF